VDFFFLEFTKKKMTNPAIFRKVKKFFAGENVETKDAMRDRDRKRGSCCVLATWICEALTWRDRHRAVS
jgi:hypothetical protein